MADCCPPLAGCEAADLPYCVMLGTPCEGARVDSDRTLCLARERSVSIQRYAAHARAGLTRCKGSPHG
jgi:hypothetical protein